LTEETTQLNTRIPKNLDDVINLVKARYRKKKEEVIRLLLEVGIWITSDLDLKQTKEFVRIRPHVLQVIKEMNNPEKKQLLREALDIKEDK